MYTLYRISGKHGARELVGFYDDAMEGAAAIETDKAKFDDEAQYELTKDGEESDGAGIQFA